jgi:hypothetical protein
MEVMSRKHSGPKERTETVIMTLPASAKEKLIVFGPISCRWACQKTMAAPKQVEAPARLDK